MDLVDILRSAFEEEGFKNGDEISFFCPRHVSSKRKLFINVQTQKCHCWVCDLSARSVFDLFKKLNLDSSLLSNTKFDKIDNDNFLKQEEKAVTTVRLPDEYEPLCYKKKTQRYIIALEYLRARSLTDLEILRYKIGYCEAGKYKNRVIVPSFDKNGKINYFTGRWFLDTKTTKKYLNAKAERSEVIFNELFVDFSDKIILCEGVFDYFVCGKNSIPLLGSSISKKLIDSLVTKNCPEVILAIDPDTYVFEDDRRSKIVRISKKLRDYRIKTSYVDVRPLKDVGEMKRETFKEKLEERIIVDEDFLFKVKMGAIS